MAMSGMLTIQESRGRRRVRANPFGGCRSGNGSVRDHVQPLPPSPAARASRRGSPPSPRQPPSPWIPRPRRSRPRASPSSASAPASPTSPPPTTSSRPQRRPAATRGTTATPPRPAFRSCKEAIAAKTLRDSGVQVDPSQVVVTNGGKHAVYSAFTVLIDDGDEVLLPAPFWTTYPEPIASGRWRVGGAAHRRVHRVPRHRRTARSRSDPADQGAGVRLAVQPHRGGLPA